MNLEHFQVAQEASLKEALLGIEKNTGGAIFVVNRQARVVGILTDGDIRRALIKSPDTLVPLATVMNQTFVSVPAGTSREQILKILDHKISIVPVLDKDGRLVDVCMRKFFPVEAESRIFARAKAPVRISFGGGGTDLTHYFVENGGAVLNSTIGIFSHANLKKRDDSKIIIESIDLGQTLTFDDFAALEASTEMPLILSLLRLVRPTFGLELQVESEFPVGSGLGGSAVVLTAILGCFNQYREDRWDNYEIAEMAFQAERLNLGVGGGWQDQYASVFGGFNFIEFRNDANVVHPLRVNPDILRELESNLLLCFTGRTRQSGDIHRDQKKSFDGNSKIARFVEESKRLTYDMKTNLLRGRLHDLALGLDRAWELKRQFSDSISDSSLDEIYTLAKENGAIGGKLLGAGGGGHFLFYARSFMRSGLRKALEAKGMRCHNIVFDEKGLQSWSVREKEGESVCRFK